MADEKQDFTMIWEGIKIHVSYCPDYCKPFKEILGFCLAHLEIRSEGRQRLPMTGTGYRSHFVAARDVAAHGSPVDYMAAWLDEAAKGKGWLNYKESKKQELQLRLF